VPSVDESKTALYKDEHESRLGQKLRKQGKSLSKVLSGMKPSVGLRNLVFSYMFLKVLNLANVILQILLLNFILFENGFLNYGIDFFRKLYNSENPFSVSEIFPIISFCNFYVHQNLRQIHWYTAQCILNVNVYIEKYFVILWYWFVFLIVVNLFNIASWALELRRDNRLLFLGKYMRIFNKMYPKRAEQHEQQQQQPKEEEGGNFAHSVQFSKSTLADLDKIALGRFCDRYLRRDGVLMLHMIKAVAGEIIFLDLLGVLWDDFKEDEKPKVKSQEQEKPLEQQQEQV
jgi:hypothetical protein